MRVGNQDTQALLDTGSVVTLLRPDLAWGRRGEPIKVACVHGDTRTYETCNAVVRTPRGMYTARAGIVPHLPVPLLIGRDCPIFSRLWYLELCYDPCGASHNDAVVPADPPAGLGWPIQPRQKRLQRKTALRRMAPPLRAPQAPRREGPP